MKTKGVEQVLCSVERRVERDINIYKKLPD